MAGDPQESGLGVVAAEGEGGCLTAQAAGAGPGWWHGTFT